MEPIDHLVTWVYEANSYVPCGKIVDGKHYSILSDYIGRPIQAYSEEGALVWSTDYDIYGKLRNLVGDRMFIPFRQLGQYEDIELDGLYYNRFRYYDSNSGLYIAKDPIGLHGGFRFYSYVKDSNIYVDIFGWEDIWFRALNLDDTILLDLGGDIEAKDMNARQSVINHINNGSKNYYLDQYISITKNRKLAEDWALRSGTDVVAIDLDKVDSNKIDLTSAANREKYIMEDIKSRYNDRIRANRLSEMMEEGLVDKIIKKETIVERYKPKKYK
ncbi:MULTISPECIES: RHS repeat domain-containing protein [unclassified Myroides]|uniref:RHS repeat domain-containing protein n=1 Tax=unclassified Myroides TaxID=2642485 RepID=UPI003D2F9233